MSSDYPTPPPSSADPDFDPRDIFDEVNLTRDQIIAELRASRTILGEAEARMLARSNNITFRELARTLDFSPPAVIRWLEERGAANAAVTVDAFIGEGVIGSAVGEFGAIMGVIEELAGLETLELLAEFVFFFIWRL